MIEASFKFLAQNSAKCFGYVMSEYELIEALYKFLAQYSAKCFGYVMSEYELIEALYKFLALNVLDICMMSENSFPSPVWDFKIFLLEVL